MLELLTKIILSTAEESDFFTYTNRYANVKNLLRHKGEMLYEFKIDISYVGVDRFAITYYGIETYLITWLPNVPEIATNYTVERVHQ